MAQYDETAFEALYGVNSVGAPFEETFAQTIAALDLQQFVIDLCDSFVNKTTAENVDVIYKESFDWLFQSSSTLAMGWGAAVSGAGAQITSDAYGVNATEKVIGSVCAETGSTNAGLAAVYKGLTSINFGLGHQITLRMRVALETLGSGSERYAAYFGFGDNQGGGDMFDGAYFRYADNVNGGRWECVTAAASSYTVADSGVAAVGTFVILEIRVNSSGTSAEFYINGALVATNTTDIHNTGGTGLIMKIQKSVGTTTRFIHMDWYSLSIVTLTGR